MAKYANSNEQSAVFKPNDCSSYKAQNSSNSISEFSLCNCCVRERVKDEGYLKDHANIEDNFTIVLDLFPISSERGEGIPKLESSLSASFLKSEKLSSQNSQVNSALNDRFSDREEDQKEDSDRSLPHEQVVQADKVEESHSTPTFSSVMRSQVKSQNKLQQSKRKNKKFFPEEDEKLLELVHKYGEGCWIQVANEMPGRNRKQVRERYINFFKKKRSLQEFSKEEDNLILSLVHQYGRRWHLISDCFPTRTPIMIKNHFYSRLKGRKGNTSGAISLPTKLYPLSVPSSSISINNESSSEANSPQSLSISVKEKPNFDSKPALSEKVDLPENSIDHYVTQKKVLFEAFKRVNQRIFELLNMLEKQNT